MNIPTKVFCPPMCILALVFLQGCTVKLHQSESNFRPKLFQTSQVSSLFHVFSLHLQEVPKQADRNRVCGKDREQEGGLLTRSYVVTPLSGPRKHCPTS